MSLVLVLRRIGAGKRVTFDVLGAGSIPEHEIKPDKEQGPPGLMRVQLPFL